MLVDCERLTGDGGLIDLQESIFGNDSAVGWDNGTFFDLKNVTGNDFWCFNLLKLTITENRGLESESLFQLLDDGTGLEFLDETDTGVENEQSADDTEIDPILETG